MTAPARISEAQSDPVMGPADAGFVSGLTALILPIVRDSAREKLLTEVLAEMRPHLSAAPQILGLAICFDVLRSHAPWSEAWRREIEDLRRRIVDFNEWRLGRAQEALRRRQD
jgi:hypothetical protein